MTETTSVSAGLLPTSGSLIAGVHHYPLRVYYEDTDTAGIVYYANYLKFAERARSELVRLIGLEQRQMLEQDGIAFAVRQCTADYRRPARLDDALLVLSRVEEVGGASLEIAQDITRDGIVLVTVRVRLACMYVGGAADGRPARIPAAVRALLVRPAASVVETSVTKTL